MVMNASKTGLAESHSPRLGTSEARYQRLFETAQDGILILDAASSCIIDANPSLTRLSAFSRHELIGRQLWELGLFENIALAKAVAEELKQLGHVRYENMPLRTKDGRVIEVEFVCSGYRSNGEVFAQCNIRDISTRMARHDKVVREANTDFLTGLANRKHFESRLQDEYKRSMRYGHVLSLLMLDIDHFKDINDKHGHATGDAVLKAFAGECLVQLRNVDIVGRIGGEEFCILLPETDGETAQDIGERLRSAIAALQVPVGLASNEAVRLTVSIGVATLERDDQTIQSLLARADARLYEAKQGGRNCVRCSPPLPIRST